MISIRKGLPFVWTVGKLNLYLCKHLLTIFYYDLLNIPLQHLITNKQKTFSLNSVVPIILYTKSLSVVLLNSIEYLLCSTSMIIKGNAWKHYVLDNEM